MIDKVESQIGGEDGADQLLEATREKLERIRLHMDREFSKIKRGALSKSSENYEENRLLSEERLSWFGKENLLAGRDGRDDDARVRIAAIEYIPRFDEEFTNSTLALLDDFSKRELAIALIASEYMVRKLRFLADAKHYEEQMKMRHQRSKVRRLFKAREELIQAKAQIDKDRRARRRGAMKANAESYAMKQDVFTWLDQNFEQFGVLDSATDAIAKANLVPAKWRTIRGWCTEWKKLRSASGL